MNIVRIKCSHLLAVLLVIMLTRTTITLAQVPANNYIMSASEEVLSSTITYHPAPKISQDLRQLIEAGVFLLQKNEDPSMVFGLATFDITQDGIPVIGFSEQALLDPTTTMEALMIAVYHEFRHYEQWRDQMFDHQHHYKPLGSDTLTPEEATAHFYGEMDAFCVTTEFVQLQGWMSFSLASRIYSEQGVKAFAKQLVEIMTKTPKFSDHHELLAELAENWEN